MSTGRKIVLHVVMFLVMFYLSLPPSDYVEMEKQNKKYQSDIVELKNKIASNSEMLTRYKSSIEEYESTISELNDTIAQLEGEVDYHESINGDTGGVVYVTKTGKKYHKENCSHVSDERFMISYNDAIDAGYEACARCH